VNVREAFLEQEKACAALGSDFMGRLMGLFARRLTPDGAVSGAVLQWQGDPAPYADNVPLRLAGALHGLKLSGLALVDVYPPHSVSDDQLWQAVSLAMQDHEARLLHWLSLPPQTNEVRRSAVVLAAMSFLMDRCELPFQVFELGCSGGLNLFADQFSLRVCDAHIGQNGSSVTLTPDWSGTEPSGYTPRVLSRRGVDINPLDPTLADDQLRLLAYLWPDQPDRIERTKAAIEIATRNQASIDQADAGEWLTRVLEAPTDGAQRLVFHTIAWQYFPAKTARLAMQALDNAGECATRDAPLAH